MRNYSGKNIILTAATSLFLAAPAFGQNFEEGDYFGRDAKGNEIKCTVLAPKTDGQGILCMTKYKDGSYALRMGDGKKLIEFSYDFPNKPSKMKMIWPGDYSELKDSLKKFYASKEETQKEGEAFKDAINRTIAGKKPFVLPEFKTRRP